LHSYTLKHVLTPVPLITNLLPFPLMILLVCSLEPKESSSCSWDASMLIWIWIKRKVENLNLKIEKKREG
jgi:hypothetical protein